MSDTQTAGAREEFEQLFQATRASLSAYLVNRCKDAELAADLFSETYLIAWQKLNSIPPGDQARLWLFGVARNLLLKGFRQRRVADALVERLAGELHRANVEHSQIDDHPRALLHAALDSLSEGDREILTLTAWEGLTPGDRSDHGHLSQRCSSPAAPSTTSRRAEAKRPLCDEPCPRLHQS
jgi:RNA polymerase sigma factor (sigma-70 family)